MSTLLSFGEALIDLLPQQQSLINEKNERQQQTSYLPLCGGAPANVAVAYAKLGGESYFAGGISNDHFGQLLYQQLQQFNVKTTYIAQFANAPSAVVVVNLDDHGERSFNFYRHNSADMFYSTNHVNNIDWSGIDIFHFCSNTLTNKALSQVTHHALQAANTQRKLISFDVNLRQSLWESINQLPEQVEQCYSFCDILKFSKDEIEYLAQQKNINTADYISLCLRQGVALILITDGANAIKVFNQSSQSNFMPPQLTATDTTAAGDSFIASFLYWLGQHKQAKKWLNSVTNCADFDTALRFASQCSALTCMKKGGFVALPTHLALPNENKKSHK